MDYKICTKCGRELPLSEFHKNKRSKDGYESRCKECRNKQIAADNKEKYSNRIKQYFDTPMGRASRLVQAHKVADKKHNRGECTITAKWIVENIFEKKCSHCDETDWRKMGCNRLDNSKPHTSENVEPCCCDCNRKLGGGGKGKQIRMSSEEGIIIKQFQSLSDASKWLRLNGYPKASSNNISNCCNGKLKTAYGYIWSFEPLDQPS